MPAIAWCVSAVARCSSATEIAPRSQRLPIRHIAGKAGPTCSWPHGHPGAPGFRFCGKRVVPGKPYCPEHAAMAYIQPKERKVQAA